MGVRKICRPKGCRASPRCEHPWWFDVMHDGKRWRMLVDDFALMRGATEPVTSKQTAERVWEPKFLAEIVAGGDPRQERKKAAAASRADGRRVPGPLLRGVRRGGRPQERRHDPGPDEGPEGVTGASPGRGAGEADRHRAVQGGVPQGPQGGDGQPRARHAAGGDQLGTVPGSAAARDDAVPPVRREHQGQGRNEARSAGASGRGTAPAGGLPDDEHGRAQVVRTGHARSPDRRARDVLPAGRDAAHPEPARGLVAASDRDPRGATPRTRRTGASRSTRRAGSRRS